MHEAGGSSAEREREREKNTIGRLRDGPGFCWCVGNSCLRLPAFPMHTPNALLLLLLLLLLCVRCSSRLVRSDGQGLGALYDRRSQPEAAK